MKALKDPKMGTKLNGEPEDEETREMRLSFEDILNPLKSTTKENMEERERLAKLKKGVPKQKLKELIECSRKSWKILKILAK